MASIESISSLSILAHRRKALTDEEPLARVLESCRKVVLVSDGGGGKSTTLLMLAVATGDLRLGHRTRQTRRWLGTSKSTDTSQAEVDLEKSLGSQTGIAGLVPEQLAEDLAHRIPVLIRLRDCRDLSFSSRDTLATGSNILSRILGVYTPTRDSGQVQHDETKDFAPRFLVDFHRAEQSRPAITTVRRGQPD